MMIASLFYNGVDNWGTYASIKRSINYKREISNLIRERYKLCTMNPSSIISMPVWFLLKKVWDFLVQVEGLLFCKCSLAIMICFFT